MILQPSAQSHGYKFRHLTTSNGLSSDYVNVIFKDSRGFVWIGTDDGLNRYDGYTVTIFRNNPDDSTSLSDNEILAIIEDDDGNLLIGTSKGGMNKFDYCSGRFIHHTCKPGTTDGISGNKVNVICRDTGNVFWLGTDNGLDKFYTHANKWEHYLPDPQHPADSSNRILAILKEDNNNFWIGTQQGLFRFHPQKEDFEEFPLRPDFSYPLYKSWELIIHRLFQDRKGVIWIGTQWFLYRYDHGSVDWIGPDGIYVSDSTPNSNFIFAIAESYVNGYQILWLATSGGLNRYDTEARKFLHILSEANNPDCLSSYSLTAQFMDEADLLWIGNYEKGVDILDLHGNPFQQPGLDPRATDLPVLSFLVDSKGTFWAGLDDHGLLQMDQNLKYLDAFRFRLPGGEELQNCDIDCIFEDHIGNIWIGNSLLAEGLYIFDPGHRHFEPVSLPVEGRLSKLESQDDYIFNKIIEDQKGIVWIGTRQGLFRNLEANSREMRAVLFSINDSLILLHINDLMEDRAGNLWIAPKDHGICFIGKDDESAKYQLARDLDHLKKFGHKQNVNTIFEDHAGQIWLGTSHGLFRIINTDSTFQPVHDRAGLLEDNPIYGIIEDHHSHLWLNSKAGLLRYSPDDSRGMSVRKFDRSDGLPYDHFSRKAFYISPDGRIFAGGAQSTGERFFYFYPDSVRDNTRFPVISITDFRIRNEAAILDSVIQVKKYIRLKHDQNFFSFEFAALNYVAPGKNQYAYYLDGLEDDWIYSGNRRYVSYSSVPPGEYLFRVKGSNNNGYWNEQGTAVHISITPPPWRTWWAYLLYGVLISGVLVIGRWNVVRRLKIKHAYEIEHLEARKLKELDSLKSRFFANISHEFRTPLTLILGPLQNLFSKVHDEAVRQDLNIMQRNARRLQNLINELLDLSRLESGKMELHASSENIVQLVKSYVQQFESLAKHKGIALEFHSETDDIPDWVDRDKIEKILYNLLSNAFKFTDVGGRIEVTTGILEAPPHSPPFGGDVPRLSSPPARRGRMRGGMIEEVVIIAVTDTGAGIPSDQLPHIFDRFYQGGQTYIKDGEGTGIGLALAKELVELHGGTITVESVVDRGSAFRIFLPLLKGERREERGERRDKGMGQEEKSEIRSQQSLFVTPEHIIRNAECETRNQEPGTRNSEPLILIVEDNADVRLYIRGILGQDYQILEAGSGRQGLEKALEHVPDLVLTDVMMPEMDGFELSRKLKGDERTSHIPIILLTARAGAESRIEGLETGADDFITKPFDPEELKVRIRNLISQRKKLKEQYLNELGLTVEEVVAEKHDKLISMDQRFLLRARSVVEDHLGDEAFDVEHFSDKMNLSRTQVHRKLRALINQSASEFIRTVRLNHARLLLSHKTGNISEIALEVGFSNPAYFSECFRKQYGLTPSEYVNSKSQSR